MGIWSWVGIWMGIWSFKGTFFCIELCTVSLETQSYFWMDMVYSLIPILHHKKQEIPFLCIRVETTNTSSSFIQSVGPTHNLLQISGWDFSCRYWNQYQPSSLEAKLTSAVEIGSKDNDGINWTWYGRRGFWKSAAVIRCPWLSLWPAI